MNFSMDSLIRWFEIDTILIAPFILGATTILAHHGVGSSTLDITPTDSVLSSSSLTSICSGRRMLLGVNRAYGFALQKRCY